jgi:hypothetical protein
MASQLLLAATAALFVFMCFMSSGFYLKAQQLEAALLSEQQEVMRLKNFIPTHATFNNFMQGWPFMQHYTSAYSNIFELQGRLNELKGRGVVGNVGYFGKQVSTYAMGAAENQSICETGFGSGHSAVIYLSESSDSSVVTFDLGAEMDNIRGAKQIGLDFINEQFTGRHTVVHMGRRQETHH